MTGLIEDSELYDNLNKFIGNLYIDIHAIYYPESKTPNRTNPFSDCYLAAVDLFREGNTFRLYFKINDDGIRVEWLEKWWFG